MAERRMFSKLIIDSDAFLDMPLSTQALYFHLSMRADDDGFVNNPKKVMRMVGAAQNELELLIAKRYLLTFDSGIVVIKHWRIHNYIQKDRYKETSYLEEKSTLMIQENKAYTEYDIECIQDGYTGKVREGKSSEGKISLGKDSLDVPCSAKPNQLDSLMKLWNDSGLPNCGCAANITNGRVYLNSITGFGYDFIAETIVHLGNVKDTIDQQFIPSFDSFMSNNKIGKWHDYKPDNNKSKPDQYNMENVDIDLNIIEVNNGF